MSIQARMAQLVAEAESTDVDGFNPSLAQAARKEMGKLVKGAGEVVDAVAYAPAKGGGFAVTFDTEYAGLKAFYYYRTKKGVALKKVAAGWLLSVPE